ncbi:MAG: hypothetical protein WAQ98_17535 [Blastocatellia bacterium]
MKSKTIFTLILIFLLQFTGCEGNSNRKNNEPQIEKSRSFSYENEKLQSTTEIIENVSIGTFLEKQPPNSIDSLNMEAQDKYVIVFITIILKDKSDKKPLFETTFSISDGTNTVRQWEAASINNDNKYRALFILSDKVNGTQTKIRDN